MADNPKPKCRWTWPAVVTGVLVFTGATALAGGKSVNAIASIKVLNSGQTYEVAITSEEPFLRSDLPVLRIGDQDITISRAPADGSSDTRVFILTPEQFRKTKSGDKVAFQWGRGEGKKQLDMGTFDKGKLEK